MDEIAHIVIGGRRRGKIFAKEHGLELVDATIFFTQTTLGMNRKGTKPWRRARLRERISSTALGHGRRRLRSIDMAYCGVAPLRPAANRE
jgi:hypothetical protein